MDCVVQKIPRKDARLPVMLQRAMAAEAEAAREARAKVMIVVMIIILTIMKVIKVILMIIVVINGDFSGGCDCLSVVEDLWRWWFTALLYVSVIAETNLSLRNHTCLAHIKHVK